MFRIRRRHGDAHQPVADRSRFATIGRCGCVVRYLLVYVLLVAAPPQQHRSTDAAAFQCRRTPAGHGAFKSIADGRFHVRISENSVKYTPGETYTITLEGIDAGSRQSLQPVRHKFSSFTLVVESSSGDTTLQEGNPTAFGVFSIISGTSLTKITCANMVTHTTTAPKSEIKVLWTAPESGSGCVAFRATVVENRDVWYMDDGPLTKVFCEDEQTMDETLSGVLDPCCACTEAKYELTFEGLWSRNTHPKDFPSNNWLTRFSDIIGATHTADYRFWNYGEIASDGLKQVAESGATRELEAELKDESDKIRTIIKARGLAFPHVTDRTFAVFRVDRTHHLMSFVTMVDPSPDWFLGVSGLEMCLENCSWVENKVLDLYPWDAGTDSGPTYISPDQPTNPRDSIRRIRPDAPNDPRSPFYEVDSNTMKPLARLYLSRQRLYEKDCDKEQENVGGGGGGGDGAAEAGGNEAPHNGGAGDGGGGGGGGSPNACGTTRWSRWSPCDVDCGTGQRTRTREARDPDAFQEAKCAQRLQQRQSCTGKSGALCAGEPAEPAAHEKPEAPAPVPERRCILDEWSEWSECEPRCGEGRQNRTRAYLGNRPQKVCAALDKNPIMEQFQGCSNPACDGDIAPRPEEEQQEEITTLSPNTAHCLGKPTTWTNCSHQCGGGISMSYMHPIDSYTCRNVKVKEVKRFCKLEPCKIPQHCYEDPVGGDCTSGYKNRYFYNYNASRCDVFTWSCATHGNRFEKEEDCLWQCTGITPMYAEKLEKDREDDERNNRFYRRPGTRRPIQNNG